NPRTGRRAEEVLQLSCNAEFTGERLVKYRYTKYTGNLLDDIDIDDLVSKLSDLLLSSGFNNPWGGQSGDADRAMHARNGAILEALFSGGMLWEEALQQLLGEPADGDQEQARQQLHDLVQTHIAHRES